MRKALPVLNKTGKKWQNSTRKRTDKSRWIWNVSVDVDYLGESVY